MNIAKKDYPFWVLIAVGVCVVVFLLMSKGGNKGEEAMVSASPTPVGSVQPTPGLIVTEGGSYRDLLVQFDGFRIALDANCQSAQPSNVSFKNMTQIMLDNSASDQHRTVKIGDRIFVVGYVVNGEIHALGLKRVPALH